MPRISPAANDPGRCLPRRRQSRVSKKTAVAAGQCRSPRASEREILVEKNQHADGVRPVGITEQRAAVVSFEGHESIVRSPPGYPLANGPPGPRFAAKV